MSLKYYILLLTSFYLAGVPEVAHGTPWGKDYFPNLTLTTDDNKKVQFFEDLIKDKIVAINFIYTTCPDTCPLETAGLVRVQKILGDRMGKDVHFYSISIDPKRDTPKVLKEYKKRFGAKWTFLTGSKKDVTTIRKKLGLFITKIQDDSKNHNVSMIIGNQATGQWMKRSPFENAHVLADQLGNWLSGWKSPQREKDYAQAPILRHLSDGEKLFRTRCISCHTIDGSNSSTLGPDLIGVNERREKTWLIRWLKNPKKMLKEKDPIAMEMYNQYNKVAMADMRLTSSDIFALIKFFDQEQKHFLAKAKKPIPLPAPKLEASDAVATMNAWIRETDPKATVNAGYMTLVNAGEKDRVLTKVECSRFKKVEIHEMAHVDGLMEMKELKELRIPAQEMVKLKPMGKHLMMIDPDKQLKEGENIEISLIFNNGDKQTISVKVKK